MIDKKFDLKKYIYRYFSGLLQVSRAGDINLGEAVDFRCPS